MSYLKTTLSVLAIVLLATGCIDVEYVGQKFAPLPDDVSVRIFKESVDYSPEDYKVIGRATFSAPNDTSSVDMWDKVMAEARETGADGVKIISSERELVSSNYRQPVADGRKISSASGGGRGVNSMGEPIEVNTFGEEVAGNSHVIDTYEVVLKVLFLKSSESFAKAMEARKKRELELIEKSK